MIQDDEGKTTIVPLIRDEITIGRKEGNTIRLTERNVSRRHARILRNNGEVHIEDLGSYNGIRVNNARIAERVSLRVSDQVQIGDYKLYLKAAGLEQADEGHTVPHERVESQVPPTEPMTAVTPAVTAPHPIHQAPTAPQLIGNPNRTLVAIADTDPNGRTIGPATAEAVAALTATVGYGKLVVLSSNFAGKEFELSRPQMIIGRTDENDIVINHRSISRNHAKLVREPDTGRYTISDLQSSNGVRVNGQDYGKVELRRGDVIDLGHVRLRFVEAGEDFVFARDAVITDVPEAGGRRGLVVAVVATILVVIAGIVVYTMRGTPDKPTQGVAPVTAPPETGEAGTAGNASDEVATAPHGGSETADAPPTAPVATKGDDKQQKLAQCAELNAQKKWQDLLDCAGGLEALGLKDKARELKNKATQETANEGTDAKVRQAIHDGSLSRAQALLKTMSPDSVYHKSLTDVFERADATNVDEVRRRAQGYVNAHDCAGLKRFLGQQTASGSATGTEKAIAVVKESLNRCQEKLLQAEAARPPTGRGNGSSTIASGSGSAQPPPPAPPPAKQPCDTINVDDAMTQAQNQYTNGFASAALSVMIKALNCRQTMRMYQLAALYACAARDLANAKTYFGKLTPAQQPPIEQRCQQEGLNIRGP
ncbi:MAG TPA: FHA domain-containing protein [Kofleriaceae bacterium]|nr:FHA domain-containing protein [Kofleriaceae bacterium]